MQIFAMSATVRFRGFQSGTAGSGDSSPFDSPNAINYMDLDHAAHRAMVFECFAANTLDCTQILSDLILLDAYNTLELSQIAIYQKVSHHELVSTLFLTDLATVAGGQHIHTGGGQGLIQEVFYVDASILSSKSVTLLQGPPIAGSEIVLVNGNQQTRGSTEDYTITGSTIVFNASWTLELDDKITIKYLEIV